VSVSDGTVSGVPARSGVESVLAAAVTDGDELDLRGAEVREVRAAAVRDLLLHPTDARGLRLRGARIVGQLDLDGLRTATRIRMRDCEFVEAVTMRGASVPLLDLSGSATAGLLADDATVEGSVLVRRGFTARGLVSVVGARIGSKLDLAAHYLDVAGTVYLDGVRAAGGLRLSGSRIAGQVLITDAEVDGGSGPALAGTRVQVSQAVVLDRSRLRTRGEDAAVDLRAARVAGDLELRQTRLSNPGGTALRLATAVVEGRAILSETVVEAGGLDLRDATVGALHDDPASVLPDGGRVEVTGLTYRGVPGRPGVTVAERLAWLRRMPAYAAQPYRQLAAAYQAADRVGLAIDAAVPLVGTGAADRCVLDTTTRSGQGLAAAGWLLTLLGRGSATLVVAGYTGLVRRA
jgi:hypothetical protein